MEKLYTHTENIHNTRAAEIVAPLILRQANVSSVLDVGCGTGTWLKVFYNHGVKDVMGLDGDYVDKEQLVIEPSFFSATDLRLPFDLKRKFDLLLCLEVAEHLSEENAGDLITSLCRHSNTIVFSAAVPGQGGQNHLNEQWPVYWQNLFAYHGFYFHDVIRPLIWNNVDVDWWYRQNIFLVSRTPNDEQIKTLIHPECFTQQERSFRSLKDEITSGRLGVVESFKIFLRSIRNKASK